MDSSTAFLPRETLLALAPAELPILRPDRYDGGGQSAQLHQFPAGDIAHIQAMYEAIQRLHESLLHLVQTRHITADEVRALREREELKAIIAESRLIGSDQRLPLPLRSILHDIRGGSLVALLVSLQLLEPGNSTSDDILRCFFYARDHLKMMRNGISDLDPVQTERDRSERPHGIGLLREKWSNARFAIGGVINQVTLDCEVDGEIANRCLEFSALDRVIYNLVNNAARYSVDHAIELSIFSPGPPPSPSVRFVLQNKIAPDHAARIEQLTGGDPNRLLSGGLTTGGNGLGLAICSTFVSHAYGLRSVERVIQDGYAGARIIDGRFVVWFHWPRA